MTDQYDGPHTQKGTAMRKVCGAKTRKGTPCQGLAMENGRCRMHGGNQPKGMASPNWKHGRYSKHMGTRLGPLAYEAAHDPNLLDLTELVAVYQVRIQEALELLGTSGFTAETAEKIVKVWGDFRLAQDIAVQNRNVGQARMIQAANEMDALVASLGNQADVWRELDLAAINLKKLAESERKRRIEAHSLIPVTAANNFAYEIMLLVRQEISDPTSWNRIEVGITDLLGKYPAIADSVE